MVFFLKTILADDGTAFVLRSIEALDDAPNTGIVSLSGDIPDVDVIVPESHYGFVSSFQLNEDGPATSFTVNISTPSTGQLIFVVAVSPERDRPITSVTDSEGGTFTKIQESNPSFTGEPSGNIWYKWSNGAEISVTAESDLDIGSCSITVGIYKGLASDQGPEDSAEDESNLGDEVISRSTGEATPSATEGVAIFGFMSMRIDESDWESMAVSVGTLRNDAGLQGDSFTATALADQPYTSLGGKSTTFTTTGDGARAYGAVAVFEASPVPEGTILPITGSVGIFGNAPTVDFELPGGLIIPESGLITVTPQQPAAAMVPPGDRLLKASFKMTASVIKVYEAQSIGLSLPQFNFTGLPFDFTSGGTLTPDAGQINFSGDTPTVTPTGVLEARPTAGDISIAGFAPTVVVEDERAFVSPSAGQITLEGEIAEALPPNAIGPKAGSLSWRGQTSEEKLTVTAIPQEGSIFYAAPFAPVAAFPDAGIIRLRSGFVTVELVEGGRWIKHPHGAPPGWTKEPGAD